MDQRVYILLLISLLLEGLFGSYHDQVIGKLRKKSNPDVIPIVKNGYPVEVTLTTNLINVAEVDLDKNEVELHVWNTVSWRNRNLMWDQKQFGNISSVSLPTRHLWIPDIVVQNAVKPPLQISPFLAIVSSDGTVSRIPNQRIRIFCDVSNLRVSFGSAVCIMKLSSWTYDAFRLTILEPNGVAFVTSGYFEGSKFEVYNAHSTKQVVYFPCCPEPYEVVNFIFTIRKKQTSSELSSETDYLNEDTRRYLEDKW